MKRLAMTLIILATALSANAENLVLCDQNDPQSGNCYDVAGKKRYIIRDCEAVTGLDTDTVVVKNRGRVLGLRADLKRKDYKLQARYRYFACVPDGNKHILRAAKSVTPNQFRNLNLVKKNFPENKSNLSKKCSSIRSVGGGVLWKPDSDVNDNRGGKPVVLFQGSNKPRKSAITIYASNGAEIGKFTYKLSDSPGINGNADHYYSGWTGGSSDTSSSLASKAQAQSGNSNVYFSGPGTSCFGPVNPHSRTGGLS